MAVSLDDLTTGGTIQRLTRWTEPVMHRQTRPVTAFHEELHTLIRDMFATMEVAEGVGLASTQVGVDLAVFIYECPDEDFKIHKGVVCNPEVELPTGKERRLDAADEGCLSWPGAYQLLSRPDRAVCRGVDANGDPVEIVGTGLLARCLQHETDHLKGIVFGDRLSSRARRQLDERHEELRHLYPDDWPLSPKA